MAESIDRRKFLKLTSAAGLGLGFTGSVAGRFEKYQPANRLPSGETHEQHPTRNSRPANRIQEGPHETTWQWSAEELWARSTSRHLILSENAIVLEDHILIEEDAPGLGSIQPEVWETIASGTILRKRLNIDRWPVRQALISMLVYPDQPPEPFSGGKLEFRVNSHDPIVYEVRHFWTSVPVPAEQLHVGENIIEVTVPDKETRFRTLVSLHENYRYGSQTRTPPSTPQSERSIDGGATWTSHIAEASGNPGGEYPIRLRLHARHSDSWLQTPVIDLADNTVEGVMRFPVEIDMARVDLDVTGNGSNDMKLYLRSGGTHQPGAEGWSDWSPLTQNSLPEKVLENRFIQLRLEAKSGDGDNSPRIRSLRVHSRWRNTRPGWAGQYFVRQAVNRPLVRSSFDFVHEDPVYPDLQKFRRRHRLDDVVDGARTEIEKIKRLRGWAAGLWDWYMPAVERGDLITWNSQEILAPGIENNADDVGGFCLYYAILLAQACQSFGIPARMVNLNYSVWGGHEVPEVWSRDYEKWIMVDAQFDTMFVWRDSGVPLSVIELHQVFLDTYYSDGEVINRDAWTIEDRTRRTAKIDPDTLPIRMEIGGNALSGRLGEDYVWWRVTEDEPAPGYAGGYGFLNTAYIRWLPRSNWMSQPLPMPISHGRTHWGWDGYLAWTDPQTPRTPEHRHFVFRESDMNGMLFGVDYSAEPSGKGKLQVHMATNSPGFDHFELSDNGRHFNVSGPAYLWELATGVNTLEMRSVDALGNRGPASRLTVNYMPG